MNRSAHVRRSSSGSFASTSLWFGGVSLGGHAAAVKGAKVSGPFCYGGRGSVGSGSARWGRAVLVCYRLFQKGSVSSGLEWLSWKVRFGRV